MLVANIRKAIELLDAPAYRRWLLNVPLGLVSAAVEMATAAAIFAIIAVLNGSAQVDRLPLLAPLVRLLPPALSSADGGIRGLLVVTALLVLAKSALAIATTVFQQREISRDRATLATRLYEGYLRAPYAFHLQRSPSDSVHRIDEGSKVVFETVLGGAATLLHSGLLIGGLLVMLLWANFTATLSVGTTLALWVFASVRLSQRAFVRLGEQADRDGRARQRVMWEGLTAVREVKIFAREAWFRDRFAALQEAMVRFYTRTGLLYVLPQALLEAVFSLGMLAATAIVLATSGGAATLPVLGLYAYVGVRLIPTANVVIVAASKIVAATGTLAQLHEDFLVTMKAVEQAAPASPPLAFHDRLEVDGVGYRYEGGARPALHDVSFELRRGESLALVGRNGAGKTTLMHILFGLLEPDRGSVRVDGVDIRSAIGGWQRMLGYVPQTVHLIEDTLARNVAFGIPAGEVDPARVRRALDAVQLGSFVDGLADGADTMIGGSGIRLSGGQTQRLAIARALYHDPELLLLDEASSALDYRVEREVAEALASLRGARTLIVIAHRASTVARCDRVALLREGELVEVGSCDELLERSAEFRELLGVD